MVPVVRRGYSFKGLTAYLVHDKPDPALAASPRPQTAVRIGFTKLVNFLDGEARTPDEAAKVMAVIVRDAEKLKRGAGIKPGGTKAKAPPVYHMMLSWHEHEQIDDAGMMRAGAEALEKAGLGLEKGYLTCAVSHTDTRFRHIHFEVCLVHPETGKQVNPHDDQVKLQKWARAYEKQRGQIFCHDREAKHAAIDRARASRESRAAFNDNAGGMTAARSSAPAQPDKFGRSRERVRQPRKGLSHTEWEARKTAGNDNPAAQQAADRIKADTAAKWASLRSGQAAAFERRNVEASRFYSDRKDGRNAIFEKYQTALDGVWKPQGGPKQASPDLSRLAARVQQRQQAFEANEKTALGRVRNALTLGGKGSSLFKTARLAVSKDERRRVFERGQRAFIASIAPRDHSPPSRRHTPKTPEPKRVQAERLKAMRTAEVAQHGRETTTQGEAMKGRHAVESAAEKDASAALSKEIKTAWREHNATHSRKPEARAEQAPARTGDENRTQDAKPDRFGRGRERTRQPRTAGNGKSGHTADTAAEPQNSPVERGHLSGEFSPAGNEQAPAAQPEAAREGDSGQEAERPVVTGWTKEERQARIDAERERQAERDREYERDNEDTGRTYDPC